MAANLQRMARIEIDVDDELLGEAATALGTQAAADTVRAALELATRRVPRLPGQQPRGPVGPGDLPGTPHPYTSPPQTPPSPNPGRPGLPGDFPPPPEVR